jgi:hypothetical protein
VTREVHKRFWWGDLRERGYLENIGADGRIILKWIFKNCNGGTDWIDWLRIRTGGGLL